GLFGGGLNDNMGHFGVRQDWDLQILWQLQNLGLGNRALVQQRRAENQLALLASLRLDDQIAAGGAQAFAQAQSAAAGLGDAEAGVRVAVDSFNRNLAGMSQTISG